MGKSLYFIVSLLLVLSCCKGQVKQASGAAMTTPASNDPREQLPGGGLNDAGWTPAVTLQLLSVVQDVNSRLGKLENSLETDIRSLREGLEEKLEKLEANMEGAYVYMNKEIDTKLNKLSVALDSFENRVNNDVNSVETRLGGDLTSMENRIMGRLGGNVDTSRQNYSGVNTGPSACNISAKINKQLETLINRNGSACDQYSQLYGRIDQLGHNVQAIIPYVHSIVSSQLVGMEDRISSEIRQNSASILNTLNRNSQQVAVALCNGSNTATEQPNFPQSDTAIVERLDDLKSDMDSIERRVTSGISALTSGFLGITSSFESQLAAILRTINTNAYQNQSTTTCSMDPVSYGRIMQGMASIERTVDTNHQLLTASVMSGNDRVLFYLRNNYSLCINNSTANAWPTQGTTPTPRPNPTLTTPAGNSSDQGHGQTGVGVGNSSGFNSTTYWRFCQRRPGSAPYLFSTYSIVRPSNVSDFSKSFVCDTTHYSGGWIVIQRRSTGDVDFYRGWDEYKAGFGNLSGDFWLGNERIHQITNGSQYELMVVLKYRNTTRFSLYNKFNIMSEIDGYKLVIGKHVDGRAGDPMILWNNNTRFSTSDVDNDVHNYFHLAAKYTGPWWHRYYIRSNLNGKWGAIENIGPSWATFSGSNPCTFTEMKIRRLIGQDHS